MKTFELQDEENIIFTAKGTNWEKTLLFMCEQNSGEVIITNQRFVFNVKILMKSYILIEENIENVVDISKCNVGSLIPWNPTGIKIVTSKGKIYKISSLRREKIINELNNIKTDKSLY